MGEFGGEGVARRAAAKHLNTRMRQKRIPLARKCVNLRDGSGRDEPGKEEASSKYGLNLALHSTTRFVFARLSAHCAYRRVHSDSCVEFEAGAESEAVVESILLPT